MKIGVIGAGYVGLVSGVCLASKGHQVCCLEIRRGVVDLLNEGMPTIHEEGLPELLSKVVKGKTFSAAMASPEALEGCSLILLAVGTPCTDGEINLKHVEDAVMLCANYIKISSTFVSVVVKSTVIPGTTDDFVRNLLEKVSGKKLGEFGLGMNPEFLREGFAIQDFMDPDRIVFGHEDPATLELLKELYSSWVCDKISVNTRTAEMIKYANNCLLATQISAVNELANLATALGGVDIDDVMKGVHLDRRWNPLLQNGVRLNPGILSYLLAGCGFGGSCFPKDVQALRTLGRQKGTPMRVLQAVLDINEKQPLEVVSMLQDALKGVKGRSILLLGLAFKPGTEDLRESAAVKIAKALDSAGALVSAHDPAAGKNARIEFTGTGVQVLSDWISWLPKAEAVVVATAWPEYQQLADSSQSDSIRGKVIVDARRMFQPSSFSNSNYLCIGRRMSDRRPNLL
jgi:UDPglucose 6-dehydrogenase/GDP-mannose 6-dehydrogenase